MYLLGGVIVLATFGIVALLVFKEMPAGSKDALMLICGQLVAGFLAVVGYFFGSSKSSADKTALIQATSAKAANVAANAASESTDALEKASEAKP